MRYGARNMIRAKVKSVKKGDIMALAKFEITIPAEMASVLTTESVDAMDLKPNDEIQLSDLEISSQCGQESERNAVAHQRNHCR